MLPETNFSTEILKSEAISISSSLERVGNQIEAAITDKSKPAAIEENLKKLGLNYGQIGSRSEGFWSIGLKVPFNIKGYNSARMSVTRMPAFEGTMGGLRLNGNIFVIDLRPQEFVPEVRGDVCGVYYISSEGDLVKTISLPEGERLPSDLLKHNSLSEPEVVDPTGLTPGNLEALGFCVQNLAGRVNQFAKDGIK